MQLHLAIMEVRYGIVVWLRTRQHGEYEVIATAIPAEERRGEGSRGEERRGEERGGEGRRWKLVTLTANS